MTNKTYILIPLVLLLLSSCGGPSVEKSNTPTCTVAFFDLDVVFDKFQLTQELNTKLQVENEGMRATLDSMRLVISKRYPNGALNDEEARKLEIDRSIIQNKERMALVRAEELQATFQQQILSSLDVFIEEFQHQQGFTLLVARGEGISVYGSSDNNVTSELIEFVNNKYRGE